MEQAEDPSKATDHRIVGWLALIIAFILPSIIVFVFSPYAFDAWRLVGNLFALVLIAFLLSRYLNRRESDNRKARTTLVIGALALLYSTSVCVKAIYESHNLKVAAANFSASTTKLERDMAEHLARPMPPAMTEGKQDAKQLDSTKPAATTDARSEREVMTELLNKMAVMRQEQAKRLIQLNQRFDSVSLDGVILPANLTRREGIRDGRNTLKVFSGLISERTALYDSFAIDGENVINSVAMKSEDRARMLKMARENWARDRKNFEALAAAQTDLVSAMNNILDLADEAYGKLTIEDGKLYIPTQEQADVYQRNIARILKAAKDEAKASAAIEKVAGDLQGKVDEDLKKMQR